MTSKFIVHLSGPISKYRLDLFNKTSPNVKDHILFFTNKDSYDFYAEYHDKFNFIFIDDFRKDESESKKFEIFPDPLFKSEEEYFKNVGNFYKNEKNGKYWPLETRRFIFKYLLDQNILNFCIVNNNIIFNKNPEIIKKFFDKIPPGSLYAPFHDQDRHLEHRLPIWNSLQSSFSSIQLSSPFLRTCDGFLRGHHFYNKEDMTLYYDLWNACVNKVLSSNLEYGHNGIIIQLEWISSHIMQFFEHNKDYSFFDYTEKERVDGNLVFKYITRPEDKLFPECRIQGWNYLKFDYSNISSISNFIRNNKEQLNKYYSQYWGSGPFEITDDHVITYLEY